MAARMSVEKVGPNLDSPGYVDGKHFTTFYDHFNQLKRERRHDEAIELMLKLIAATEAEFKESGGSSGVAPWYYEQLAIIYRKEKRLFDEIMILERYARQTKASDVGSQKLAERLTIAREKLKDERLGAEKEELETPLAKLDSRKADTETERAELESWQLEMETSEADRQAEQTQPEAKKSKASKSQEFEFQPMAPIIGTAKIAQLLREAKNKKEKPGGSETELVEFRISRVEEFGDEWKTLNKQPGRWIQPGELVTVGEFEIQGGFFYVGGQLKGLDDYYLDNDPSLIDPTLAIDSKSPDYAGVQMDYYPSYSWITPQSRAAYLEWLVSDRTDPEAYIGYVFLYFYGIERRLLIDDANGQVSEDERKALVQELKRLKNTYGDHRSFHSYVTALLSYIWTIHNRTRDAKPDYCLLVSNRGFTPAFKFLLAQTVQDGNPIDEDLALAWVRSHPEFTLRRPARRCPVVFDELFRMRYRVKFGDGLEITPNRTRLQLDYFPASVSLRSYQSLRLDLPDVSRLSGPFKKLIPLAESCASELAPFSRFVGRPGNTCDSLSALALLPNDLTALTSNPHFENLKAWMRTQVTDSSELVSVDSLLQHFGKDAPLKINKKEAEMLSSLAEKAGYGVAPDSRYHHAKPYIGGKIALFPGGHGESFSPSSEFRKVGTILRLGCLVAITDDHVSDSEVKALKDVISQDSRLTVTEKRSLDAYMLWRLNTPADMSGLKKRLDLLSASEKVAISHILVGVALADGKIEPEEVKQLEKLYTQLGLDKGLVASDIHNLSSSRLKRPDPEDKSSTTLSIQPATSFALDRDLLRLLEEETKEAQSILESIFVEEDLDEEDEIETPNNDPANSGAVEGLDIRYQELYGRLITKADWTNEELEELCHELQLMTAGAVETINDWAFDRVGAPLIENGSPVFVDLDLAEEISTMQTQEQMP